MLRIYTFGGLQIEYDKHSLQLPPGKSRDLLTYIILHQDRPISRTLLAGIFWPDQAEDRARQMLSHGLWQIRSSLGPVADCLRIEGETVAIMLDEKDWLDVAIFKQTHSSFANHHLTQPSSLSEAVALYKADFLEGCYDDWALLERERLHRMYLEMLEWLIALHKRRGEYKEALAHAQQLAAADPLSESIHQELMRLCHLLGRDKAALEQYETLRHILETELKVEPSAATMALAHEIAKQLGEPEVPYLPVKAKITPVFDDPEHIPLVGRDEERAKLLAHLEKAINGQGRLVLLEGEAGVGKTRLTQELAQDAQWRGVQVYWGKGQELTEVPPYNLFRETLRDALSPLRANQLKTLVKGFWLREACLLLPELTEWLPDLPPRVMFEPGQQRIRFLEGLTQITLMLGQIMPHVLILDDLQWADAASMSALSHLANCLAESHTLVIGCYRGEEIHQQPTTWEALQALDQASGHKRLLLKRLNAEQTRKLVQSSLGITTGLPAFERRVYQETDGNPLFVLETLRTLRDNGELYQDDSGMWNIPWNDAAAGDQVKNSVSVEALASDTTTLPAGVYQVINRRLAGLSADEMTVIKMATILGGDFNFELLAQASQMEAQTALPIVNKLVWQRFLVESPHAYRFSHDKIRQVAYTSTDETERQKLHIQAGQTLEALHPDQVERLAHHFYLGKVWGKAMMYSHQAGKHASEVYAHNEALISYTQALEACQYLQMLGEMQRLHMERGKIHKIIGQFDQAEADFRASYKLAKKVGDKSGQVDALNKLSGLQLTYDDPHTGLAFAQQAFDLASKTNLSAGIADSLYNQASALGRLDDYQAAIELGKQATATYEKLGDLVGVGCSLGMLGMISMYNSDYAQAQFFIKRSLAVLRQTENKRALSQAIAVLAQVWSYQGEFFQAQEDAQKALEIASSIGDRYGEAYASYFLGEALLEQGHIEQTIYYFQHAIQIAREIGKRESEISSFVVELAHAYHLRGDLEKAKEMLEQSLRSSIDIETSATVHIYLAALLLEMGQCEGALSHARIGLQVAKHPSLSKGRAHRLVAQATAQLSSEKTDENPTHHFEESIQMLRQIGAKAELTRSLMAYGLYLKQSTKAKQANRGDKMLAEARESFERLGMAKDLAQLKAEMDAHLPSSQIKVRLPRIEVPTGHSLHKDKYVNVTWTVSAPDDDDIPGKTDRRQHRLLRLLQEAADQSAVPRVSDLAEALEVHVRTIQRDLDTLRSTTGWKVHTQRSRSSSE